MMTKLLAAFPVLFSISVAHTGNTDRSVPAYSEIAQTLKPGSIYQHYKGQQYMILSVARHTETLEELVVYQSLYGDYAIWIRPLQMFVEEVIIDGCSQPRFKLVKND